MNIKEARQSAELTQKQVFNIIGIPMRTLQDWESGRRKCPEWCEKLIVEKLLSVEKCEKKD